MTDLSGFWGGVYAYPGGARKVVFDAEVADHLGALSGTITEPNTFASVSGPLLSADLTGERDGDMISFKKTYNVPGGPGHTVLYTGQVDDDGTYVRGNWSIGSFGGTFEMRRDAGKLFDPHEITEEIEF